jgi:hypothetical protein
VYLDGLVAVRLVTLEGSGVLLHDGVLLERSDHFLLSTIGAYLLISPSVLSLLLHGD